MLYHTPVLEDKVGQVTPSSAAMGNPGIPLTESGTKAAQLRPVSGVPSYAARGGLNQGGAVGALQSTDAVAFNGFVG